MRRLIALTTITLPATGGMLVRSAGTTFADGIAPAP